MIPFSTKWNILSVFKRAVTRAIFLSGLVALGMAGTATGIAEVLRGEKIRDTAYIMVRSTSFQPLHLEIRFDVDVLSVSSVPPTAKGLRVEADNGAVKIVSSSSFMDNAVDLRGLEVVFAGGNKVRLDLPPVSIGTTAYSKDIELPPGTISRIVPPPVTLTSKLEFGQIGLGGAAAQLRDKFSRLTHQQRMGLIIYAGLDRDIFVDNNAQRIKPEASLDMNELEALAKKLSPADLDKIYTAAKDAQWMLKKDHILLDRSPMEAESTSSKPARAIHAAAVSSSSPGSASSRITMEEIESQLKKIRSDYEALQRQQKDLVSGEQKRDLISYFGSLSFLITALMVSIILYMKYIQQRKITTLDRGIAELNERAEILKRSVEEAARRSIVLKKNVDEMQRINKIADEVPALWTEVQHLREELEALTGKGPDKIKPGADKEAASRKKESSGDGKEPPDWKMEIV